MGRGQLLGLIFNLTFGPAWVFTAIVHIEKDQQEYRLLQAAAQCFASFKNETESNSTVPGLFCDQVWDRISCWPRTPAGEKVTRPCPNYVHGFNDQEFASRTCTANGTWFMHPTLQTEWTDYRKCLGESKHALIAEHMDRITLMYSIGYGCSLIALLLAVIIMLYFRKLRCPRNTIHINLFVSFILRASISFSKEYMLVDGLGFSGDVRKSETGGIEFIPEGSHWECKLFFSLFHYLLASNYTWILVEGVYLHMLISWTQFSENGSLPLFIIFGWCSPLLYVIPWVVVRATLEDLLCWNTNPTTAYFWIMRGPIVASVVVNFIIFLSIIRILFIKLNAFNAFEAKKFRYRKLAKSTLVLIPLFGVHYIIMVGVPEEVDEVAELVKLYFELFFNSIQGLLVALLFCFFNGEVQAEILKKWHRYRLSHHGKRGMRRKSTRDTITSYLSKTRRGSTLSNSNSSECKETPPQNGNCVGLKNGRTKPQQTDTNGHSIYSIDRDTEETQAMVDYSTTNGYVDVHAGDSEEDKVTRTTLL